MRPSRPGVPSVTEALVAFFVMSLEAATTTPPGAALALVPMLAPRVALAEVLMLLMATAAPTPPLSEPDVIVVNAIPVELTE